MMFGGGSVCSLQMVLWDAFIILIHWLPQKIRIHPMVLLQYNTKQTFSVRSLI